MTKSRLTFEEKVLCGLVVYPGFSAAEKTMDDEAVADEMLAGDGFIPMEEISAKQVRGHLPRSIARDAMDPADVLPRNMRLRSAN